MPGKIVPAASFAFLTPLYDMLVDWLGYGRPFKQRVLDLAKIADAERILDIGCGTATLLVLAKQQHPASRVLGFDIDREILAIARRNVMTQHINAPLFNASAEMIPLASSSIDVAVSSLIFHHLPTAVKKQALLEIRRVLKPNGRFLLADFGLLEGPVLTSLYKFMRFLKLPEAETMQDNMAGKLPAFIKDAGFAVEEIAPPYRGVRFYLMTKQESRK